MIEKNKIIDIFKHSKALLNGHFVLTSGRHSDQYFQCARVLQYPRYLKLFGQSIAEKFRHLKPDLVISPAIGGIVLSTQVGLELGIRSIFSERKNGEMVIRRGFKIKSNENVLIVEDVITTGGSVKEVMDLVTYHKANVIGIGILVDRSNQKVKLHKNQFSLVNLDVKSYNEDEIPEILAKIPIKKPGSRYIK